MVSIIISAHKPSPFLEEAIYSATHQDYNDYEVILSSDGCPELQEVALKHFIWWSYCEKGNNSTALNRAVRFARGEWIKEVHYDDILMSNCLKDMMANVGDASLIYANSINFFTNGREQHYKPPQEVSWESMWPPFKCAIHGASIMYRKDAFLEVGGWDEELEEAEEYDFYLRLLKAGKKFKYVDSFVSKYRRHEEQKTASFVGERRSTVARYLIGKYATV